ncbi:MAG: tRNA pseudouridine(13) synthase TruD [Candidatus Aenigmatarchaeota archaeon]
MKGIGGRLRQRIEDFRVEEIPKPLPEGEEFTIAWMEKFNWDTNSAVRAIAKRLHISSKRIGVAGTKDKRAVTKQRISFWNVPKERIENLKIRGIKLSDFGKSGRRIKVGDLEGNRFVITIRDVKLSEEEIRARLGRVFAALEKGIPNFFGPQRFGEVRPTTHLVGREMLKGNFEEAAKIYLTMVFEREPDDAKAARKLLAENWGSKEGYLKALRIFPMRLKYERSMLDYLAKFPNDFGGAIRRMPLRMRKMMINAFQSFIFNQVAKEGMDTVKLPGYDTKLGKGASDQKIKKILEKEGVKIQDFRMLGMPELACTGSERKVMLVPKDLKIEEIADDDFNDSKKKVTISFSLPSGAYATVVLNKVMGEQKSGR